MKASTSRKILFGVAVLGSFSATLFSRKSLSPSRTPSSYAESVEMSMDDFRGGGMGGSPGAGTGAGYGTNISPRGPESPLAPECHSEPNSINFSEGTWVIQSEVDHGGGASRFFIGARIPERNGIVNPEDAHYRFLSTNINCLRSRYNLERQMSQSVQRRTERSFQPSAHRPYCDQSPESLSRRYEHALECPIERSVTQEEGFYSTSTALRASSSTDLAQLITQAGRPSNVFPPHAFSKFTFFLSPLGNTATRRAPQTTGLYLLKIENRTVVDGFEIPFILKQLSALELDLGDTPDPDLNRRLRELYGQLLPDGSNYAAIAEILYSYVFSSREHGRIQEDWVINNNGASGTYARTLLNTSARTLKSHWDELLRINSLASLQSSSVSQPQILNSLPALGPAATMVDVSTQGEAHRLIIESFANRRVGPEWVRFLKTYAQLILDFTAKDVVNIVGTSAQENEHRLWATAYWWGARRLLLALGCGFDGSSSHVEPLVILQYQQQTCRRYFASSAHGRLGVSPLDARKIQNFLIFASRRERARYFTNFTGQFRTRASLQRGLSSMTEELVSLLVHEYLNVRAELETRQMLLWTDLIPLQAEVHPAEVSDEELLRNERQALRDFLRRLSAASRSLDPSIQGYLNWAISLE